MILSKIEKGVAVVTDSAANQLLGTKMGGYHSLKCIAHLIQLAIKDAFKECPKIQALIDKCKEIVKFFKKSGPAMNVLLKAQSKRGTNILKLLPDVATRWNS